MLKTEVGWIRAYQDKGALWIHDGNPKRPHALLTSGKHSSGFFNSSLVIEDEGLLEDATRDLVGCFISSWNNPVYVDGIVGPQTGATKLARSLSCEFSFINEKVCFFASPAKGEEDGKKVMIFSDEEANLLPDKSILLCEDVITTGGSVEITTQAVVKEGGKMLPFVLTLVNRSGHTHVGGRKIVALISRHMPIWEANQCPLCKQGSVALRPKGENWPLLNATY